MDSVDRLQKRARRAYEAGRLRLALLGVAPLLAIVAVSVLFAPRPESTLGFGMASAAVAAALLWYGQGPQRAVLPGTVAGLIPLVAALCMNGMHHCASGHCSSYCVEACTAGGIAAGLVVALVGRRYRAGASFWVSSSALAILTGAMGCACVGYSGVVGLVAGFAAGLVPALAQKAFPWPQK